MNDATEALVDAARSWSPDQVRRYSEKAHAMINALADAIDPEPQPYPPNREDHERNPYREDGATS